MREFINIIEAAQRNNPEEVMEGKVHQADTGFGHVSRMTKIFENPTVEQAETLATSSMRDGLLYLRGILYKERTLFVAQGHEATHYDLLRNFFPRLDEHSSEITTFEVSNYRMKGITPIITDVDIVVLKQGDYWISNCPSINKLLEGCKRALATS